MQILVTKVLTTRLGTEWRTLVNSEKRKKEMCVRAVCINTYVHTPGSLDATAVKQ